MSEDVRPQAFIDADLRDLRDPKDIRALAHPTRLALLDMLSIHGPLTATQAAELIGESPASCSFHLRTLAKHHFVEETGAGKGRQRPWRVVKMGTTLSNARLDPQAAIAAEALSDMYLERQLDRLRRARAARHSQPPEWEGAFSDVEAVFWVTPEEVEDLKAAIYEVALRYRSRLADPSERPEGAEPIEMLVQIFKPDFGRPPSSAERT